MRKVIISSIILLIMSVATNLNAQNKSLVAYFSASGTTEKVAKQLAPIAGADLFEIVPVQKYSEADLDWTNDKSRSSVEMKDKKVRPEIKSKIDDFDNYSTIYIGFPIWWNTAPRIINTFLESYDFSGKTVIFFATSGGSSISNTMKVFKADYPKVNFKTGVLLNSPSKETLKKIVQ